MKLYFIVGLQLGQSHQQWAIIKWSMCWHCYSWLNGLFLSRAFSFFLWCFLSLTVWHCLFAFVFFPRFIIGFNILLMGQLVGQSNKSLSWGYVKNMPPFTNNLIFKNIRQRGHKPFLGHLSLSTQYKSQNYFDFFPICMKQFVTCNI